MGRMTGSRRSPAIVVAVLALVAAVAGTAVAGDPGATISVSKKKTKQIAKKQAKKQVNRLAPGIANEEITKRAPGLSVNHANTANSANSANSANPIAFALVAPNGGVVEAQSKNVSAPNVSRDATGLYCFRNLGFAFKGGQVTVDYATTPQGNEEAANFALGDPFTECNAPGAQAVVNTYDAFNGNFEDLGFFVHFYD